MMEVIITKNEIFLKYDDFENEKKLMTIFTKIKSIVKYQSISYEKNLIRFCKTIEISPNDEKEICDFYQKITGEKLKLRKSYYLNYIN